VPQQTEGRQRAGAVIANNMIYWRVLGAGVGAFATRLGDSCPEPREWFDEPRPQAAPDAAPLEPTRPLAEYIDIDVNLPSPNPDPALVQRLHVEISRTLAADDHWMPYYFERGFSSQRLFPPTTTRPPGPPAAGFNDSGNIAWHDPGELLFSLAAAYPYLDPELQARVQSYGAQELARYSPLVDLPYSPRPWLLEGAAREPYEVPMRQNLNVWPPPAAPLNSLYALWLWSKNTGDWSYAREHWEEINSLYEARRSDMSYYADIAGVLGYIRLAEESGHTAEAQSARLVALAALENGKDVSAFIQRARRDYPEGDSRTGGLFLPAFYGITPEIGLFLREQTGGRALAEVYEQEGPDRLTWWYLTRAGSHGEASESSFIPPIAGWSHFMAHAYIAGDSQAQLSKYLDFAWAPADLYSIQKLVATIQAP
jgi:hypothetical protein